MQHNLPKNQPYQKFFGRKEQLEKIHDDLIRGGTYIASIDGVGGIGKTALAYYFCKEIFIPNNEYDYLVWLTAKHTTFDSYSASEKIKKVENVFAEKSLNYLFDETLKVYQFDEFLHAEIPKKRELFEDIVQSEKILFIFDNLETIKDNHFFDYLKGFNKFSYNNKYVKILTTSRKRKRISDFPIEIEELSINDAYDMLLFLANNNPSGKPIKEILNANEYVNKKLIERVGKIPIAIEFVIGQMIHGVSRGDIFKAFEGFPNLDTIKDKDERNRQLSDIIIFSFENMYETLDEDVQTIFQVIASLVNDKKKDESDITIPLLMNYADIYNILPNRLEKIIEELVENQLISREDNNSINMTEMSINLAKQYYKEFATIDNQVMSIKDKIVKLSKNKPQDDIDLIVERATTYISELDYNSAERLLLNAVEGIQDPRLYYELAKVQGVKKNFVKANDNYKRATQLDPKNTKIWFDWIQAEDKEHRRHIAEHVAKEAIKHTNYDFTIVTQLLSLYRFFKHFTTFRDEIETIMHFYKENERKEDLIKLLNSWKQTEYMLIKKNDINKNSQEYFRAVDILIDIEDDYELKLNLLKEKKRVMTRLLNEGADAKLNNRIKDLENKLRTSIGSMRWRMNKYMSGKQRDKDKAIAEAKKILKYSIQPNELHYRINALRVIMQINASEKNYKKCIKYFEQYKDICKDDENCSSIYSRANKEIMNEYKKAIIEKINQKTDEIERKIKNLIMTIFNNDDQQLIEFVKTNQDNSTIDWTRQWEITRNKSLDDVPIIQYAELSSLKTILQWVNKKLSSNSQLSELINEMEYLVSSEENSTLNISINNCEINELEEINLKLNGVCTKFDMFENVNIS